MASLFFPQVAGAASSNDAFNQANAAFDQANAAFNQANTGGVSSFGTVNVNGTLIVSGIPGDILNIGAGTGIGVTGNNVSNTVTISSTVSSSGSGNELQFSDGAGGFYSLASMYLGGGGTYGTLNLDGTNSNLFLNDSELGLSNYSAMGNYPYMTVDSTSGYVSVYYTFGAYNTGYVQLKANAALKFYSVWSDGVTTNKYEIQLKSPIPTSTSGVVTYDLILPSANANANDVLANDGTGNTYWTPILSNALPNTSGAVFAGDLTVDGNLTIGGSATYVSADSLSIGNTDCNSIVLITSSAIDQILDSFSNTVYHSANYILTMNADTDWSVTQISLVQNGTDSYITEYGLVYSSNVLGTFSTSVDSGIVRLNVNPTFAVTTIKMYRTATQ